MSRSIFDGFYDYQLECVEQTNLNDKGIIVLPTGTGKTRIQAGIIANDILIENKFKIYIVNCPRILLSFQLFKELYSFNLQHNLETISMFVHSGGSKAKKDLEKIRLESKTYLKYSEVNSSTNSKGILQEIERAKKLNIPIIFYSTYNSSEKIQRAIDHLYDIEICMNDEAHFLTQERFSSLTKILKAKRFYFFTATIKISESEIGLGMNNIKSFGDILYSMSPREAIERGKMCRPRLHFLETTQDYNIESLNIINNQIIFQSYKKHYTKIAFDSRFKKIKLTPKILVCVKGSKDIKDFLQSEEYLTLRAEGVNICIANSRKEIGNQINGEFYRRDKFLEKLKDLGENLNERMIVLHYDILAEGIDVSGFTAILLLRKMEKSKLLQTIGRGARLMDLDRKNITIGRINPMNPKHLNRMIKPYTWVIIPSLTLQDNDITKYVQSIVENLREYGFDPAEDIYGESQINGIPEPDQLEGMNYKENKKNHMMTLLKNIKEEFEHETIASLMKNKASIYKNMSNTDFLKSLKLC